MFFLTVLAFRPCPTVLLAICCEYQTSDSPGRRFLSALNSFCHAAYMASVASLRASRLTVPGVWRGSAVVVTSTNW